MARRLSSSLALRSHSCRTVDCGITHTTCAHERAPYRWVSAPVVRHMTAVDDRIQSSVVNGASAAREKRVIIPRITRPTLCDARLRDLDRRSLPLSCGAALYSPRGHDWHNALSPFRRTGGLRLQFVGKPWCSLSKRVAAWRRRSPHCPDSTQKVFQRRSSSLYPLSSGRPVVRFTAFFF